MRPRNARPHIRLITCGEPHGAEAKLDRHAGIQSGRPFSIPPDQEDQHGQRKRREAEVAKYGTAHVKRAYGDWTGTNLKGWKDQLLAQPIQQFAYTSGKNATDAAMVIDAMDLLYSARFDGFCIVSSDGAFTRLAARIRESGLTVTDSANVRRPSPSSLRATSSSTSRTSPTPRAPPNPLSRAQADPAHLGGEAQGETPHW